MAVTDAGVTVSALVLENELWLQSQVRWGGSWENQEQLRGRDHFFPNPDQQPGRTVLVNVDPAAPLVHLAIQPEVWPVGNSFG